jgi:hypothetical protein
MDHRVLEERLLKILTALREQGYSVDDLVCEPPATSQEVAEVEAQLGFAFPASFRDALITISRRVDFWWRRPDNLEFPAPFEDNVFGQLSWSISSLVDFDNDRKSWIETVFKDPDDAYDRVWHQKLAVFDVGNGDLISIDLEPARAGTVVYLSHDGSMAHGYVLAPSFAEFIRRWTLLACPDGEEAGWIPFFEVDLGLSEQGEPAKAWRRLLRLESIAD